MSNAKPSMVESALASASAGPFASCAHFDIPGSANHSRTALLAARSVTSMTAAAPTESTMPTASNSPTPRPQTPANATEHGGCNPANQPFAADPVTAYAVIDLRSDIAAPPITCAPVPLVALGRPANNRSRRVRNCKASNTCSTPASFQGRSSQSVIARSIGTSVRSAVSSRLIMT